MTGQAAVVIDVQGGDYEHVLEFAGDGFAYRRVPPGPSAKHVLGGGPFGAAEFSLASHIMLHARGERRLTAIPVFPSRAFRNAAIYVAQDSKLRDFASLAGKRIGVSEFGMTTAVWTRGHIQDATGIGVEQCRWVIGEGQRFPIPTHLRAEVTSTNLEDLLASGEIDALLAGKPKDLQRLKSERRLRCLVDDPEALERAYFADTGMFPIMHTVVLHPDPAADASLAPSLFAAYTAAKRQARMRRLSAGFLPFAERAWQSFGDTDPCRYGLAPDNRRIVETLSRYLREQGLIDHEPETNALFVPGAAEWRDE